MPLKEGASSAVISSNIGELVRAGHPQKQAAAIAYKEAGKGRTAKDAEPRAAAGVMMTAPDGRTLFLRRSDGGDHAGEWCFPGGGIEDGETPEAAARREVREETGHWVDGLAPIDYARGDGLDFTTFRHAVPERFVPRLNGEHTAFAWAHTDNPPQPLHSGVAATLKTLRGSNADTMPPAQDCYALDRAPSSRRIDQDGHLHVSRCVVSRAVVSDYLGEEINRVRPELNLNPTQRYKLYRVPSELEKGTPSLNGKPLLSKHQPISAEKHPKPIVAGSLSNVVFENGDVLADIVVWNQEDIDDITDGSKKELSCGYRYWPEMEPGTTPSGEYYDGRMMRILFNHCTIVHDARVAGSVVADSNDALNNEAAWQMLGRVLGQVLFHGAMDADWEEGKHPRSDDGKFGKGSGGGKKTPAKAPKAAKEPKPKATTAAKPKAKAAPKPEDDDSQPFKHIGGVPTKVRKSATPGDPFAYQSAFYENGPNDAHGYPTNPKVIKAASLAEYKKALAEHNPGKYGHLVKTVNQKVEKKPKPEKPAAKPKVPKEAKPKPKKAAPKPKAATQKAKADVPDSKPMSIAPKPAAKKPKAEKQPAPASKLKTASPKKPAAVKSPKKETAMQKTSGHPTSEAEWKPYLAEKTKKYEDAAKGMRTMTRDQAQAVLNEAESDYDAAIKANKDKIIETDPKWGRPISGTLDILKYNLENEFNRLKPRWDAAEGKASQEPSALNRFFSAMGSPLKTDAKKAAPIAKPATPAKPKPTAPKAPKKKRPAGANSIMGHVGKAAKGILGDMFEDVHAHLKKQPK